MGLDTPPVEGLGACLPANVGRPPRGGFLGARENRCGVPAGWVGPAGCCREPLGTTPASAAECRGAGAGVVDDGVVVGVDGGLDAGVVAGAGVVPVVLVVVCEPVSPDCVPEVLGVVCVPVTG